MTSPDPPTLLHEFFSRTVEYRPDRTAVEIPPGSGRPMRRSATYAELARQAGIVTALLRPFVQSECVVAIFLPRQGEHLYSSQLGVLKAGAAYTCLDPALPDEQVREILVDSQAVALLADAPGLARARRLGFKAEGSFDVIGQINQARDPATSGPPPTWLSGRSLAYIIYTSGTTGRPKGVMIEHRSIVNLIAADVEEFVLPPEARVGQSSSAAYDSSVEEIWLAFSAGATLVVMDDETARLGPDLIPWLRRERISVLCPPPTLLRATGCADPATALPDLTLLYVGGEPLPRDVADAWVRGRRLVNGYGPTECTVTSLRGQVHAGEPVTIGRPIRGTEARVLSESLEEVAGGGQGELFLSGVGLARGYHGEPELTARNFCSHPEFGRIYRTGDLVHRDPEGAFVYDGRLDAQVKLRGYRIELEAVESRLAGCAGVREAACRVQADGAQQTLVAFIVPADPQSPPAFDALKLALGKALPSYMVPGRFSVLTELPKTIGGKLNRNALPLVALARRAGGAPVMPPRTAGEHKLAAALRRIFPTCESISVHDDFFNDLAGDSLNAAQFISVLRDDPETASLAVRDIYEARTVAELAKRVLPPGNPAADEKRTGEEPFPAGAADVAASRGSPSLATLVQCLWLLLELAAGSTIAYVAAFCVLPFLARTLGLIPLILLAPVMFLGAAILYTPVALLFAVTIKRVLIGRYQPLRAPVWGGFYVRNWMVQQTVRLVPWRLLDGTEFQLAALRALGVRIGQRVHVHRGVNLLHGGWDLLDIGDDVTLSQDANVRLVDLEDGQVIVGPVWLGEGATLEVRAGVGPYTRLERGACLTALSALSGGGRIPEGERWDGVPAQPAGLAPSRPELSPGARELSPAIFGLLLNAARFGVELVLAMPLVLFAISAVLVTGVSAPDVMNWLFGPTFDLGVILPWIGIVIVQQPLTLALAALLVRALGRVPEGVIPCASLAHIRVRLKTGLVEWAGEWLSGGLFWPVWLRWAGMSIGPGCEISTIIDVVPEMVGIQPECFLADGIYLGGPRIHRGTVTLAACTLGKNTFLGNHVVVAGGQNLPADVLLGICTVADDRQLRSGSSWFGHPPFELPRREIVECDRRLTHEPSLFRYLNRQFWEWLRFALPAVPLLVLLAWFKLLAAAGADFSWPVFHFALVPAVTCAAGAVMCLVVLALKWALLGRVRPGTHPLWSCWCSRWDFLYVAWGMYARPVLTALEGTLLLPWYLRAMGARVGRRVVLGDGFAQVVDPDMLRLEDEATVNGLFQAHTFEDRVLKIDRVTIRRRATVGDSAVLLYGADIGAEARVAPHSVVMKQERLLPGRWYAGCPVRPLRTQA